MRRVILCAALAAVGCTTPGDETGSASGEVAVTWTNAVGVATSGNSLTKTSSSTLWDAGAASIETIAGDGYVEFTTAENTTAKMAGLSVGDGGPGYADIDYAVWLKASGAVGVYEAGALRGGNLTTYVPGDVFRVAVTAGEVIYSKNGDPFYASSVPAGTPLGVDASLYTPGATIEDVQLVDTTLEWQNGVGVAVDGTDLTKSSADSLWNAGASSRQVFAGDGYVLFTAGENTTAKMAGLGSGDASQHYSDIEYAIWLKANGVFGVYEAGVLRGANFGTYAPGDVFRVAVAGGVVRYSRNGALFYTSAVPASFPLGLDTSLYTPGATIQDARLVEGFLPCMGPFEIYSSGSGLEECTVIVGDLTTYAAVDLPALRILRGKLTLGRSFSAPALTEVDGNIFAEADATSISLPALTTAYSFSAGRKRTWVVNLDLSSLTVLGGGGGDLRGRFLLRNPKNLVALSLPSLRTMEGSFIVYGRRLNHDLQTIAAPVLESIAGGLTINSIESLTSLDFSSITSVGPSLSIASNAALPECYATAIRDQLLANGWSGTVNITGNDPGGTCP